MFGKQVFGDSCGCGCAGYVQLRRLLCEVNGTTGATPDCSNNDNAAAWANTNYPLSGCGFEPKPSAWEWDYSVTFDAASNTTPDSAYTTPCGPGFQFANNGTTWVNFAARYISGASGGNSYVTRASFLLPYSTAYLMGGWCNGHSTIVYQKSCIMSGTPTALGYVYDIPIPLVEICSGVMCDDSSYATYATYSLVPPSGTASDPGMYPFGGDWSNILAAEAANPSEFASGFTTPGACMSPDPFYGSTPP